MASNLLLPLFFLSLSSSLLLFPVSSVEFQVGGNEGWIVPPSNDSKIYNDWASENRFQVGDSILFKYRKDSVMEVTEQDYKKCNSTHPQFFSNTGSTNFRLDHPGAFFFISGVSGHCQKGQKMIVKVMEFEYEPGDHRKKSSANSIPSSGLLKLVVVLPFIASFLF